MKTGTNEQMTKPRTMTFPNSPSFSPVSTNTSFQTTGAFPTAGRVAVAFGFPATAGRLPLGPTEEALEEATARSPPNAWARAMARSRSPAQPTSRAMTTASNRT